MCFSHLFTIIVNWLLLFISTYWHRYVNIGQCRRCSLLFVISIDVRYLASLIYHQLRVLGTHCYVFSLQFVACVSKLPPKRQHNRNCQSRWCGGQGTPWPIQHAGRWKMATNGLMVWFFDWICLTGLFFSGVSWIVGMFFELRSRLTRWF